MVTPTRQLIKNLVSKNIQKQNNKSNSQTSQKQNNNSNTSNVEQVNQETT